MIRLFDLFFSFVGLVLTSPIIIVVLILGYFDTGSPIFVQQRVGRYKHPFNLIKLRTMRVDTVSTATHLVDKAAITPLGSFLRKSKIDELLQLINVLKWDMSLVGPRPGLFRQLELLEERDQRGVFNVFPGITGLSHINKVDMSTPKQLAIMDSEMIADFKLSHYFKYIVMTALGRGFGDRVKR